MSCDCHQPKVMAHPWAQESALPQGDTGSSDVCVQSPWDHLVLWAGGQKMPFWTSDLKYSHAEKPLKVFDLANSFTSIFLAGQMCFCNNHTRCPSCPVFGHLPFMFSACLPWCSACTETSFCPISQRHKALSRNGLSHCSLSSSSGFQKVEWKINHWHQIKYSRRGARSKASWKMWSVIKDCKVQWVSFS